MIVQDNKPIEKTIGMVVSEREANYYDDSDFYATYWDKETQSFVEIEWGTTRFACIGNGYYVTVDAPADLINYYHNVRNAADIERDLYLKSVNVNVGDTVECTEGRKWKGKFGVVKFRGRNKYDYGRSEIVGIKIEGVDKLVYRNVYDVKKVSDYVRGEATKNFDLQKPEWL